MAVQQGGLNASDSDLKVAAAPAGPGLVETGPGALSQTISLGSIIAASPDEPVHILFVHGIRAGDRGASATFRANLSARLQDLLVSTEPDKVTLTHRLDVGPSPGFTYMGEPVWPNEAAWSKGAFVDRYEYARKSAPPIIVDEVNWWPLALPLRCAALLKPEAYLAGADVADLRLCAALGPDGQRLNDDIHFPFLSKADFETLAQMKPPGGGAARVNGFVKRALMDWGLSDAVIALGPMQTYLQAAIGQAFSYAADRDKRQGRPVKFVVISESLGSFILFDAYAQQEPSVHDVLDATAYVYFFANQFGLLELGRLSHAPPTAVSGAEALASEPSGRSLHHALTAWAGRPQLQALVPGLPARKQIIAFSDPSDALTFRVPPIDGVTVVNVYDRNGVDFLHQAADPVAAHTGHSSNPHVLDLMLRR